MIKAIPVEIDFFLVSLIPLANCTIALCNNRILVQIWCQYNTHFGFNMSVWCTVDPQLLNTSTLKVTIPLEHLSHKSMGLNYLNSFLITFA